MSRLFLSRNIEGGNGAPGKYLDASRKFYGGGRQMDQLLGPHIGPSLLKAVLMGAGQAELQWALLLREVGAGHRGWPGRAREMPGRQAGPLCDLDMLICVADDSRREHTNNKWGAIGRPQLTNTPRPTQLTNTPRPAQLTNTPRPAQLTSTPRPAQLTSTPRPAQLTSTPRPTQLTTAVTEALCSPSTSDWVGPCTHGGSIAPHLVSQAATTPPCRRWPTTPRRQGSVAGAPWKLRGAAVGRASSLSAIVTQIYLCGACSCQEILRRRSTGAWLRRPAGR
jgi:hypothetical protein